MNTIAIKGYIRDIQFSHDIGNIDYDKAEIICKTDSEKDEDDLIVVQFKKYCNRYKEGDYVELKGNLRSFTYKDELNKSHVQIYVFTYFDLPDNPFGVQIDGRICKLNKLKITKSGKKYIHFILANNIFTSKNKINNYIPCTATDELAETISKYEIGDKLLIIGDLHSHTYVRKEDNEIILAHELLVKNIQHI